MLRLKHNKALIVLKMRYASVIETPSLELLKYKDKNDYGTGIINISGKIIIKSRARNTTDDIRVITEEKTGKTIIQVVNYYTQGCDIYRYTHTASNGETHLKHIANFSESWIDRLLPELIVMRDNSGGLGLMDYQSKTISKNVYMSIMEYIPTGDIICAKFVTFNSTGSSLRKYDVYSMNGELIFKDVDAQTLKSRYILTDSLLKSRNIHWIQVKNRGEVIELTTDTHYFEFLRDN